MRWLLLLLLFGGIGLAAFVGGIVSAVTGGLPAQQ
jgi:hypothetical protein